MHLNIVSIFHHTATLLVQQYLKNKICIQIKFYFIISESSGEQVMGDIVHCQCHCAPTVPLVPNAVPPAVPQWPRARPQCAQTRSSVFALRVQLQR